MNLNSTLQKAKDYFIWAQSQIPASAELEIFLSEGRGRSVVWSEKKIEDFHQAEGGGVGVRVILRSSANGNGGQQGYAFTSSLVKEDVEKTATRALEAAKKLPYDEYRSLPASSSKYPQIKEESLNDPNTFSEDVLKIQERLKEGEARILKEFPILRSVLRASFSEGVGETAILNSNGIEKAYADTHSGFGVSCLAEKDGERQEGGFGQSKRLKKDLDWTDIFNCAAHRTIALLGGKPIPSGTIPVVFDPTVACEFLSLICGGVCADSVQKGKSPLAGKLQQIIASDKITIVDDGTLEGGLSTSLCDDEGTPTQRNVIIQNGKLEKYLYDTYTALKGHTSSTGNASRAGYKSSPSSGTSNFYLEKGSSSRDQVLKETKGLYLYDVMGLHMADPISGDFSVAALGSYIEGGEFKFGVRGITLAGNLLDLLKNIDAVCSDLTFFGSIGSPTFRVSGLTVSGS